MVTRIDKPVFHSSIMDVSYDTYEKALHAEQMAEAVDLKRGLSSVMWTRTAAIIDEVEDHFNLREQQIRMAMMMNLDETQKLCSFTTNQPFEHILNGKEYRLELLLNMKNSINEGPTMMSHFIQKYYPSLYVAWISKTDLINPRYGLVGIFTRCDGDTVRYATPIIHLEKVLFLLERMHKRFTDEYDIVVA